MTEFLEKNFLAVWLLSLLAVPFWLLAWLNLNSDNPGLEWALRTTWLALSVTPVLGALAVRYAKLRPTWYCMLLLMLGLLIGLSVFAQKLGLWFDGP